jgi:hypothetical protein
MNFAKLAVDSAFGNVNKPNLVEPVLAMDLIPSAPFPALRRLPLHLHPSPLLQ